MQIMNKLHAQGYTDVLFITINQKEYSTESAQAEYFRRRTSMSAVPAITRPVATTAR